MLQGSLVDRTELLNREVAVVDVFRRPAVFGIDVRQAQHDVRDDGIRKLHTRQQRRRRRIEQTAIVGGNAKAVVALPDRLEYAVKARPVVFHQAGERRAPRLLSATSLRSRVREYSA